MSGRAWFVAFVTFAVLGSAGCAQPADEQPPVQEEEGPAQTAAPAVGPQTVNLLYLDFNDECAEETASCVDVLETDIWKEWMDGRNATMAKRVKWVVDNSQKDLYYWKIAWKKSTGEEDYLGPVDPIECRGRDWTWTTKVGRGDGVSDKTGTIVPPEADGWTYQVTVYKCDGKNEPVCLCMSDPRVGIRP